MTRVTDEQLAIHARFGSGEVASMATELIAARQAATAAAPPTADLRAALERLTRAAHAVARGDKGAGHEHEKAAIAYARLVDALDAITVHDSDPPRVKASAPGWSFTAKEIAAAEAFGKAQTEKCLEAVRKISNERAQILDRAIGHFLAYGVPLASLRLEVEGDETRVMQDGVCVARVWLEYDMNTYTIRHHYEGPALP
ncbi:MAG TPA: hypothetical protein VIX73_04745 [Kofleriaceae bacterium]|jgi:hypothetical protein